jgi:hypothetical protein
MATLIRRIQTAFLGGARDEELRALLAELGIASGHSGEHALREARRGFLRSISDEAILREGLSNLGLTGGGGGGMQAVSDIRNAILFNLRDSEATLCQGLDNLLMPEDLGDGSSGNGGYIAKAVHFDGVTWLYGNLIGTDSPVLTFSGWVKADLSAVTHPVNFFDLDTTGDEYGVSVVAPSNFRINQAWYDAISDYYVQAVGVNGSWINSSWNHVFGYVDAGRAAGSKIIKTFLNGVDVTGTKSDTNPAFDIRLSDVNMAFPDNTDDYPNPQLIGDMADWYIAPVYVTDIAVFRDPVTGKPKDPDGFPAGAIVLFSGDAASFPINKGTGGAFALTGSLTNASSSPSG